MSKKINRALLYFAPLYLIGFFTSERMAMIYLYITLFFLFILSIKNNKKNIYKIIIFLIFPFILFFAKINEFHLTVENSYNQLFNEGKINYFSKQHKTFAITSIELFKKRQHKRHQWTPKLPRHHDQPENSWHANLEDEDADIVFEEFRSAVEASIPETRKWYEPPQSSNDNNNNDQDQEQEKQEEGVHDEVSPMSAVGFVDDETSPTRPKATILLQNDDDDENQQQQFQKIFLSPTRRGLSNFDLTCMEKEEDDFYVSSEEEDENENVDDDDDVLKLSSSSLTKTNTNTNNNHKTTTTSSKPVPKKESGTRRTREYHDNDIKNDVENQNQKVKSSSSKAKTTSSVNNNNKKATSTGGKKKSS